MTKVIVAGSRTIKDYKVVEKAIIDSSFEITEIVSGTAQGVDKLGEKYADLNGIPIKRFVAEWDRLGKSAGPIRNEEMACYADALIAVRQNRSRGTTDMINRAKAHGLQVFIRDID
jgi:hypothetical protein